MNDDSMKNEKTNYYRNPIFGGNYADPSVVRVGEDYYMTHTSLKDAPGLIVWHSRDLVNWEPVSAAVTEIVGDIWAPEIVHHHGLFYIYFPCNRTNYVVTAASPEGPWSKPVDLKIGFIDPGHVVGPDGKRYLHLSGGIMAELADDGLSLVGEPRKVFEPWMYPEDWEVEAFSPEGPKLTFREGWYYLTIAEGGTSGPATSHMVAASRSRTPWGPWEHSPYNPIMRTTSARERWWSKGHGTLVDTPDGEWWMVYHAYDKGLHSLGRNTLLTPIEWTEDGWFQIPVGIKDDQWIRKPKGEAVPGGYPMTDPFTASELGLHWHQFEHANQERFQTGGGVLTVEGLREGQQGSPLLYMPSDRAYEVEVDVSVAGDTEGLLQLFYNNEFHLGLGITREGVRHYRTFKSYRRMKTEGAFIRVRLRNVCNIVSFFYQEEGNEWIKYDKVLDVSGYNHNTLGGFLSLRIGLNAIGNGQVLFRNFEYRPLPVEESEE